MNSTSPFGIQQQVEKGPAGTGKELCPGMGSSMCLSTADLHQQQQRDPERSDVLSS